MAKPPDKEVGTQTNLQAFIEERMLLNPYFQSLVNATTTYALFGDDVRILLSDTGSTDDVDMTFLMFSTFAFILFNFELCLQSYAVSDYFPWPRRDGQSRWDQFLSGDWPKGSFYFWLDLIATYSLVFELTRLAEMWGGQDPFLPAAIYLDLGNVDVSYATFDSQGTGNDGSIDGSAAQSARAGRASRAGAKAGRVVRIVRMVRLIRIVKVCKSIENQGYHELKATKNPLAGRRRSTAFTHHKTNAVVPETMDTQNDLLPESYVGKSMSEITQRRVIVGILAILMTLPLLEYPIANDAPLYATRLAHSFFYKSRLCSVLDILETNEAPCRYVGDGLSTANDFLIASQDAGNTLLGFGHSVQEASSARTYYCKFFRHTSYVTPVDVRFVAHDVHTLCYILRRSIERPRKHRHRAPNGHFCRSEISNEHHHHREQELERKPYLPNENHMGCHSDKV